MRGAPSGNTFPLTWCPRGFESRRYLLLFCIIMLWSLRMSGSNTCSPSLFQVDSWSRQVDFSEQVKIFYIHTIPVLGFNDLILNPKTAGQNLRTRGTALYMVRIVCTVQTCMYMFIHLHTRFESYKHVHTVYKYVHESLAT